MNRIERVERAMTGREPDRPPVSLWYHFGVHHGDGERFARLAVDGFRHYGFDFLKVMNDYFYPMPEGIEAVRSGADLKRIARFDVSSSPFREQLRALSVIASELDGEAFFLDTVFDPWQTMRRALAGEHLDALMEEEPDALLAALEAITENLCDYCAKSLECGSAGIFLSIAAGREMIPREPFLRFVKPFSSRVLASVRGKGILNTAHLHGEDLWFDDCLDLPADALNWWDRGPNGPSLPAAREKFPGCLMGGIDHTLVHRRTGPFLKEHVREALRLGGKERFLLAGGCSIESSANPSAIRAIVEAAREAT
ncbi:MAG: hypothetical protein Kow00128_17590 [Deltaproteobacteria bacterium]